MLSCARALTFASALSASPSAAVSFATSLVFPAAAIPPASHVACIPVSRRHFLELKARYIPRLMPMIVLEGVLALAMSVSTIGLLTLAMSAGSAALLAGAAGATDGAGTVRADSR